MLDAKKLLDALIGSAAVGQAPKEQADVPPRAGASDSLSAGPGGFSQAGLAQGGLAQDGLGQGNIGALPGGLGDLLGGVIGQLTGRAGGQPGSVGSGRELIDQARQYLDSPQGRNVASAVAGGLAGLLLGSKSGRSVTASAASLGGLALVSGLAYKAYQSWQGGQAPSSQPLGIQAAPADSAFSADNASQDTALVLARAMIAAAASDGHVDTEERGRIVGNLNKVGFQPEAVQFLDTEFANPVSIMRLAEAASTEELAVQIYTAARLTIEPDLPEEQTFLSELAEALSLSPELVAHVDAAAVAAKSA